jgi:hypothetical protein
LSSTSSSTTKTTSATDGALSQTSNPSSTITPSTDALSIGAKAGIAIAVGVASLFILGLAFAFFRARRKARILANGLALQNASSGLDKFGYGYEYGDSYSQVPFHETSDAAVYELNPKPAPVELGETLHPAELGGWDNYSGGNYRIRGPVKKHDTYYHP